MARTKINHNDIRSLEFLDFITTGTPTPNIEGRVSWNSDDGTVEVGMPGGEVVMQVGQEILLPRQVINDVGADCFNGQIIYINSGDNNNLKFKLAKADAEVTSASTLAMLTENIPNSGNKKGFATSIGLVRGSATQPINTSADAPGTVLYLSSTTAGAFTSTKPTAPNHAVSVGTVFRQHATEGAVLVHITNGFELGELHDVDTTESKTTPVDADAVLLQDSADSSIWKKLTWANLKTGIGAITGSGIVGRVAEFSGTGAVQSAKLIAPVGDVLTLVNASAKSVTFPGVANDTVAMLNIAQVFSKLQTTKITSNGIATMLQLENVATSGGDDGEAIYFKGFWKHAIISVYGNPTAYEGGNVKIQTYKNESTLNFGVLVNRYGNFGIGFDPEANYKLGIYNTENIPAFVLIANPNQTANIFDVLSASTLRIMGVTSNGGGYFAGDVGIGVDAPVSRLHIANLSDIVAQILKGYSSQSVAIAQDQDSSNNVHNQRSVTAGVPNIINNQSLDIDTQIKSDTEANMVFVDASADKVYLGGTSGAAVTKGGLTETKGRKQAVTTKTTTYTITANDEYIVCNSTTPFTVTLPAATGSGQVYSIKNINTGLVTVEGNSTDTIDGELNQTLERWEGITVNDYAAGVWIIC